MYVQLMPWVLVIFAFFSGLGYHSDLKTRTSFIEVLTSILKQVMNNNDICEFNIIIAIELINIISIICY